MGRLVARQEWNARTPTNRTPVPASRRGEFVVHYTTGQELGREDCHEWVRQIQNYHMDNRGYADIAYNFLCCRHGDVFEGRGWDTKGAHATNHNASGWGVAYLGNDDPNENDATPEARAAIRALWDEAAARRGVRVPAEGHRDVGQTACPGDELQAWVHAGMPLEAPPQSNPPPPAPPPPVSTSPARPPYPGQPVRYGQKSEAVRQMQQQLRIRGYRDFDVTGATGYYGEITLRVMKDFQKRHQADGVGTPDGVVGPVTWNCIWNCPPR